MNPYRIIEGSDSALSKRVLVQLGICVLLLVFGIGGMAALPTVLGPNSVAAPSAAPRCRDSAKLIVFTQHTIDTYDFECHPDALLTHQALGDGDVLMTCTCMVWKGEHRSLVNDGAP